MKVCDAYGAGYYYIPGTAVCVNANTGQTREDTENGTVFGYIPPVQTLIDLEADLDRAFEGVAINIAIPQPIILSGDRFAIGANWGQFEGYHAFGLAAAVTLGQSFSLNAGVGVGLQEWSVGTRIGLNFNW